MSRPIAKSLHTVTVLVNIAKTYLGPEERDVEYCVLLACEDLGLDHTNDPYSLVDTAIRQLEKGATK